MRLTNSSSAKTPKRVLLDLSHTWNSPHQTGIQRVVRSLCRELPAVCKARKMSFLPVVWHEDKFVRMDSLIESTQARSWREVDKIRADVLAHCPAWYKRLATKFCNAIGSNKLRRWLLPNAKHQGIFKLPLKLMAKIAGKQPPRMPLAVETNEDDLLILPDGYWVMMHVWPAIAAARASGTRTAVVAYDMICITHPHFFVPMAEEIFTKYMHALNEHADVVATISNTVKKQFENKLTQLAGPTTAIPQMTSFRLGAEFSEATGDVRSELDEAFDESSSTYLMVSTFEPRKNHVFVLDSFDKVWQTNPDCKLVMVGAVGWMSDAFLQRIAAHPQFNKRLFVYHNLSDAEVNSCYRRATAVVFASFTEGFGLPIVESLWHGKQTFASDTEISREVGQQDCDYFRLDDANSLRDLVLANESCIAKGLKLQRDCTRLPVTWHQSTDDLLNRIFSSLEKPAAVRRAA